ncbi:MAG: hypothetical protein H5T41_00110 [Methanomassiliicoccales archaeon]|nr:hypothetical protein [Methanomassiliicoccales archaeon]
MNSEVGFEVDVASSVKEALLKIQNKEYDAILSGYSIPARTGIDFLEIPEKN